MMEYWDLAAVKFWQTLQRNLAECQRYYNEAHEWESLITRRNMVGYGIEIEQAEKEIAALHKLAEVHSDAVQQQWKHYEEFKQYVFCKLPSKFTSLPAAHCDQGNCTLIP